MASAVRVLPTPGGPCNKNIDQPRLLEMMSSVSGSDPNLTSARMSCFRSSERTRLAKAVVLKWMGVRVERRTWPHDLAVKEKPTTEGQV